jgi:hypothetical protein
MSTTIASNTCSEPKVGAKCQEIETRIPVLSR